MAGLVKRLVIFLLTCGFIYCVPGLLLSYYLIKNPNIAKYPPELVSEVADYFQDYFTFSLRLNLVSVVCFVASIYLWFNPRQQNVQVDVDPGHNNAVELEATAISSAVDLGSQAQQHSDPTALATVGGTRHGTPTAHRSNLMDFDFGPDLDCNPSIIRHQVSSTSTNELALESRTRERHRDRTPTPYSRFTRESTVGRSRTPSNSSERGYTTPRGRLHPRSFSFANQSPASLDAGYTSYAPTSIADPIPAETVQPADNKRTIVDEIDKWVEDAWITRDQADLVNIRPHRIQTRSRLLYKLEKYYETRYQKKEGIKYDEPFDVYGTPVSYHYDLIKCSFMFRLWTKQTKINGLPEQYNPDLARDPAPGQFLPEDDDAKSVLTSVTSMN